MRRISAATAYVGMIAGFVPRIERRGRNGEIVGAGGRCVLECAAG